MKEKAFFSYRIMDLFFLARKMCCYIFSYILLNLVVAAFISLIGFDIYKIDIENKSWITSYIVAAQVGILSIIPIALTLVTIIAKNNETSIIKIYYHNTFLLEMIVSSISLLAVLCVQFLSFPQTIINWIRLGSTSHSFPAALIIIHIIWFTLNLLMAVNFIRITFDFMIRSNRKEIYNKYSKSVIQFGVNQGFPDVDDVLKELSDKVAIQIDHCEFEEFKATWTEMIDYHHEFIYDLKDVYKWQKCYERLLEKSLHKMPIDSKFTKEILNAPNRFLKNWNRNGNRKMTQHLNEIITDILNLYPILFRHIEKWITYRSKLNNFDRGNIKLSDSLPMLEKNEYKEVLLHLADLWQKSLKQNLSLLYNVSSGSNKPCDYWWNAYSESWIFLWRHLYNSVYCLNTAILNNDDIAANLFQRNLIEWPSYLRFRLGMPPLIPEYFILPDILKEEWGKAHEEIRLKGRGTYSPYPSYRETEKIYRHIIVNVHQDIILLMSGISLFYEVEGKCLADIDNQISIKLLQSLSKMGEPVSFPKIEFILQKLLRLSITDSSYVHELNKSIDEFIPYYMKNEIKDDGVHDIFDHWTLVPEPFIAILAVSSTSGYKDIPIKELISMFPSKALDIIISSLKDPSDRLFTCISNLRKNSDASIVCREKLDIINKNI